MCRCIKLSETLMKLLKKDEKEYECNICKDTGEVWGGWSGMETYECECKRYEKK